MTRGPDTAANRAVARAASSLRGFTNVVSGRVTSPAALDLLYVRSLFRPADFGGNRYPWEVTRRLAARGNRVRVVTPRPGGPLPGLTDAELVTYPVSRRTPLETFVTNALGSRVAVGRALRVRRADLVVLSSYEVAFGHFFARSSRLPAVYIYHSSFRSDAVERVASAGGVTRLVATPLRRFVRAVEGLTYRSADAIVAVSPFSRAEIESKVGAAATNIHVIPTGVDVERFHPGDRVTLRRRLGLSQDALALITVGRLVPVKRYDRAIDALAVLRARDQRYVLLVVGTGPEERSLRALARDRGVADAVRFEGFCDGDELVTRLGACDIQVCTSEFENWSLSVLEGLATGLPVVGVPRGGIPQMLRLVDERLVTSDVGPESIADRVDACLKEGVWEELSRKAREVVVRDFAWDGVTARLEALFRQVAQR